MEYLRFIHERVKDTGMYPSVGQIAKRFRLKQHYVSIYLQPLAKLGYLAHPSRGAWVLTERGLKVVERLSMAPSRVPRCAAVGTSMGIAFKTRP